MPLAAALELGMGPTATAAQRPVTIYVSGRDITMGVDVTSLVIEITGAYEQSTAVFDVVDMALQYTEITDAAPVRIYSAIEDRDIYSGFVMIRRPGVNATGRFIHVECVDIGSLLDKSLVPLDTTFAQPGYTDQVILDYLMATYGQELNPDVSGIAFQSSSMPPMVFTNLTLRTAIEQTLAQAALQATYFVDPLGRLQTYAKSIVLAPAPGRIVVGPNGDGSTYPTTILARGGLMSYWRCNEAGGTTLADGKGSSTMNLQNAVVVAGAQPNPLFRIAGPIPNLGDANFGLGLTEPVGVGGNLVYSSTIASAATDNCAIEAWVCFAGNPATSGSSYVLFYNGTIGTNGYGVRTATIGATAGYFGLRGIIGATTFDSGCQILGGDTGWHHVVFERRSGVSTIYLDGVPGATTSATAPSVPTGATFLGGDKVSSPSPIFGGIAHMAIYDSHAVAFPAAGTWAVDASMGLAAPENLQIEYDSSGILNAYYIRGKTAGGSGWFSAPASISQYGLRSAYIDATDSDTQAKAQAVAFAALQATANPLARGSFTVESPIDQWTPGQYVSVTSPQHALTNGIFPVTKITRTYLDGVGHRKYDVEFGGNMVLYSIWQGTKLTTTNR